MHIEILNREQFNQIIDLYHLYERPFVKIDDVRLLFMPQDEGEVNFILNILSICGLKNSIDFLIHGSIIDFDDIDHGW